MNVLLAPAMNAATGVSIKTDGLSAQEVEGAIFAHNREWQASVLKEDPEYFKRLSQQQGPKVPFPILVLSQFWFLGSSSGLAAVIAEYPLTSSRACSLERCLFIAMWATV